MARPRARELGIRIGTLPTGEANAITDVPGLRVGHATLIEGASVRTGVTVVLPHEGNPWEEPVFAGAHRLNGNGEPDRPRVDPRMRDADLADRPDEHALPSASSTTR